MSKEKKRCIPFRLNGEMLEYVGYKLSESEIEKCYADGSYVVPGDTWKSQCIWQPNKPFETILYYDGFERGCSSAKFRFKDPCTDRRYWMFMTDMDDLIRRDVSILSIYGKFQYCQRGNNYGIQCLEVFSE